MLIWSRRTVLVLGGGLVGLGGVAVGAEPRPTVLPNVQQEVLSAQAREITVRPFVDQAANGAVLDQTIWEYHFFVGARDRPPDQLHPSGMALLDRLARRQMDLCPGSPLRLQIQRAQEHPTVEVTVADIRARRDTLDRGRL